MIDINKIGSCTETTEEVNQLLLKVLMFRIIVASPNEPVLLNCQIDNKDVIATIVKNGDMWSFVCSVEQPNGGQMVHNFRSGVIELEIIDDSGLGLSYSGRIEALRQILTGLYTLGFQRPGDKS